jgi:polyhydroxybutyrate depolymerase
MCCNLLTVMGNNELQPNRDVKAPNDVHPEADTTPHTDNLDAARTTRLCTEHPTEKTAFVPKFSIATPGETIPETIVVDGVERHFNLHLPKNYDPSKSYPLVLAFHGIGHSLGQGGAPPGAPGMEQVTGLSQKADKENFIVAYMSAEEKSLSWNNGEWWFSKQNDVKFTSNVIDNLSGSLPVDKSRVYLVGFSNGGSLVHRAASELHDKIAAAGTVAGWLTGKEKPNGVSFMQFQSEDDPTVAYKGKDAWGIRMESQSYLKDFYRRANGIKTPPVVQTIAARNGTTETIETSTNPATGAEFKHVTIQGEGHLWYGGPGDESSSINATDMMWDFLKHHHRDDIPPPTKPTGTNTETATELLTS